MCIRDRAERATVLAAGGNPHELARRRSEAARLDAERGAMHARLRAHADRLTAAIVREEAAYQAQRRKALRAKELANSFLLDFSTRAREARADAFMTAHTVEGSALIVPRGNAKLYGSEHALARTRAFGLATAAARQGAEGDVAERVLQREMGRMAEVTYDPRFVPKGGGTLPTGGSAAPGAAPGVRATTDGLPPPTGLPSTIAAARTAALHGALVDEMVAPELPGLWDRPADDLSLIHI